MEERLKELKREIESFVNDYNVEDFYVIMEAGNIDVCTGKTSYDISIEIKV